MGALLGGMAMASSAAADPPSVPQVVVQLSLADDAVRQRWYSTVPSDSPVLLPLRQDSSNGLWNDVNGVAGILAPLTVDGDPNGTVTGFGFHSGVGLELVWTPTAVREPGRTYTARLAAGTASVGGQAPGVVYYGESTFEFSYIEATSAEFLPTVELALLDYSPTYAFVGEKCCEVVASQCAGAPSCHQCWELEGKLWVGGAWDGPGMPYLTLSVHPGLDNLVPDTGSDTFQITQHREYCIEGTATASGETTTLTACGMPTEPPVHDASGLQPVFADSCRVLPEGAYPMTTLVAVRGETEDQARELLHQQSTRPPPRGASPSYSGAPSCAATNGTPARSGASFTCCILALLGTVAWRRRWCSPR
jgi:hypothetical protein